MLMLVLAGALIHIAFDKLNAMALQSARAVLGQQTSEGERRLRGLIAPAVDFVDGQAGLALPAKAPERLALAQRWATNLAANANLLSVQVALDDGESLRVTALRGDAATQAAMNAPLGTWWASRSTRGAATGPARPVHWLYLARDGTPLLQRDAPMDAEVRQPPFSLAAARRMADGTGLATAEVDPKALGAIFDGLIHTPGSVIGLTDAQDRLLAWTSGAEFSPGVRAMTRLADAGQAALAAVAGSHAAGPNDIRTADIGGAPYVFSEAGLNVLPQSPWRLFAYAPLSDFTQAGTGADREMWLFAGLFMLAALGLALLMTSRIASSLASLAADARRIHNMDLAQTPRIRSKLREIDDLGSAQAVMKDSIRAGTEALKFSQQRLEDLITAGLNMSRERDMMALLQQMLWGARQLTGCDAVTLYIVTEQRKLRFALRTRDDALPAQEIPLVDPSGRENTQFVSAFVALRNQPVVIDDVYSETRFDLSGTRGFDVSSGYRTVSMLALPLAPREGEVIGVLQLMNALDPLTGEVIPFNEEAIRLASALASQAAVSLDNHQLVQAQQDLMDSMVRLIAGAIDAKSPYTGSHCERVPELAFMLAEEATKTTEGPLASFGFHTPDEWREFRVGAWLHDCGKMTTPEYVVDKATKLETIYDRIHEIRTRYEVLWRDVEIDYLKACVDGEDRAVAATRRDARHAVLIDDFAFIAECNLGAEYMAQERVTRLEQIGAQTWWRHFDDRLGIAYGAQTQLQHVPRRPPPALEKLLDDKPEHLIERPPSAAIDPRFGFKMEMPEYLYNHGELHNLSVSRGTLSPEERYKINEHIMQTIVMLDALPFPKNLRRVPEYAGTHHETLTGKGYPRGLSAAELSVPARIMAVADIFEALTASDRPYKKSKTLSEAIEILYGFKQRGHIDGDVFDLFLTSGVYLRFAERFLASALIDKVDIQPYLGPPVPWESRRQPPRDKD